MYIIIGESFAENTLFQYLLGTDCVLSDRRSSGKRIVGSCGDVAFYTETAAVTGSRFFHRESGLDCVKLGYGFFGDEFFRNSIVPSAKRGKQYAAVHCKR